MICQDYYQVQVFFLLLNFQSVFGSPSQHDKLILQFKTITGFLKLLQIISFFPSLVGPDGLPQTSQFMQALQSLRR